LSHFRICCNESLKHSADTFEWCVCVCVWGGGGSLSSGEHSIRICSLASAFSSASSSPLLWKGRSDQKAKSRLGQQVQRRLKRGLPQSASELEKLSRIKKKKRRRKKEKFQGIRLVRSGWSGFVEMREEVHHLLKERNGTITGRWITFYFTNEQLLT